MPDRLDPTFVRAQIELLLVTHPDVMDDAELRELALASETELHDFMEGVDGRRADAEERTTGIEKRMADNLARRNRYDRRVEAMRSLAFKLLQQAGLKKLELTESTLSIRAGTPRVIITDEAQLPPDCVRVRTEPDRMAIKERLARGETVAGAEMSNAEPVLSVRVK